MGEIVPNESHFKKEKKNLNPLRYVTDTIMFYSPGLVLVYVRVIRYVHLYHYKFFYGISTPLSFPWPTVELFTDVFKLSPAPLDIILVLPLYRLRTKSPSNTKYGLRYHLLSYQGGQVSIIFPVGICLLLWSVSAVPVGQSGVRDTSACLSGRDSYLAYWLLR